MATSDTPQWKHDVFVSFWGEDVWNNFVSRLFSAMKGADVNSKPPQAIHESRISIIVFSESYTNSRWCLNELVGILNFHKEQECHGHMLIPIFYKVRPGELRNLTGPIEGKFRSYCQEKQIAIEKIKAWIMALHVAANITGFTYDSGDEADFIKDILKCLSSCKAPLDLPRHLVPRETLVKELVSDLTGDPPRVPRVIGIHGEEGIGKTTLAKLVFNRIRDSRFMVPVFLSFDGQVTKEDDLIRLQKKFLYDISERTSGFIWGDDLQINKGYIEKTLLLQKEGRLLVLDGLLDKEHAKWFGVSEEKGMPLGTRVLVTARDPQHLTSLCPSPKPVLPLDRQESLKLLCRHLFNEDDPPYERKDDCERIFELDGGIPKRIENLARIFAKLENKDWQAKLDELRKHPEEFKAKPAPEKTEDKVKATRDGVYNLL